MEEKNRTLANVMDMTLTDERSEEEYTNELIDECTTLLSQIQDTRYEFFASAYSPDTPVKAASYAKDLIDILHDCAERIYDLKRNMEESR